MKLKLAFTQPIFILISLFIAIIILLLSLKNKNAPPTTSNPSNPQPTQLNLQPIPTPPNNVAFDYLASPIQLPSTITTYQTTSQYSIDQIKQIAAYLGFSSPPLIIKQKSFTLYQWRQDNQKLSFDPQKQSLSFSQQLPPQPSHLNQSYINKAQSTINHILQIINSHLTITPTSSKSFFSNGFNLMPPNSHNPANLISLQFTYQLNSYPLRIDPYKDTDIQVEITGNQIKKIFLHLPPQIVSQQQAPTIPLQTAINHLTQNKGFLINLSSPQLSEKNLNPNFNQATITNVEIIYILLKKTNKIIPVYQFQATTVNEDQQHIQASYLVGAV